MSDSIMEHTNHPHTVKMIFIQPNTSSTCIWYNSFYFFENQLSYMHINVQEFLWVFL